ncbi:RiPP maturation radical SAM C-methyltransferase [Methylosinus sp. Sm6]|uniref:RiPP maturation radical SAM C-methyltransferase n=1 Tax=Methylosinus sp. Sm6 TaxID=2866948 RepID=UPI001C9A2A38|nr:RiPP maturation radical SAM C-methyltransferase [Methylosinus sp. Sm6]MBY6243015.1 RiPP maturation radical SAM C-methyltransferase [Methylosinus sp. Sm6]
MGIRFIEESASPKKFLSMRVEPVSDLDIDRDALWRQLERLVNFVSDAGNTIRHATGCVVRRGATRRFKLPLAPRSEVLLIVPPFASLWYPSLAAHLLQACGCRDDVGVDVFYANLLFASWIGQRQYERISAESLSLASERFFARCAFDMPALGFGAEHMYDPRRIFGDDHGQRYGALYPDSAADKRGRKNPLTLGEMRRLESSAPEWIDLVARKILAAGYKIVGCTTTFQQTTASVAILKRVKKLDPSITTILGGANCEGEMAEGLAALDTGVDYFFSGESEDAFSIFLSEILKGSPSQSKIIQGAPRTDMNSLPPVIYDQFFAQRRSFLPLAAPASFCHLSFETSRGCWWGQKRHCTFCGLNGDGMAFRSKSPDTIFSELKTLLSASPSKTIAMTDNIMPREYFRTLIPRIQTELPGVRIFYEQKANLSFDEMRSLKAAGVEFIQPGIEALSTRLLKLMRKGVSSSRNIMVLRYGRITGVKIIWNILCGFPNDDLAAYQETIDIIPLIVHLQPPNGLGHLSLDRFSPYFYEMDAHNITTIRPLPVYSDIFPADADVSKIAYRFLGDYPSDTHIHVDIMRELSHQVRNWSLAWEQRYRQRPELKLCPHDGHYILFDTRGLPGLPEMRHIDHDEATLLMSARPYRHSAEEDQAIARKLAVQLDDRFIPLVVAREDLFAKLSCETKGDCPGSATKKIA